MREGWCGGDYVVLFNEQEVPLASESYGISTMLPGYQVLGLRGWDDFIVQRENDELFTVPTIPCDAKYFAPYQLPAQDEELTSDERFNGKVKWYITPIVFGGNPGLGENLTWITHGEHRKLVPWWNERYAKLHSTGEPH